MQGFEAIYISAEKRITLGASVMFQIIEKPLSLKAMSLLSERAGFLSGVNQGMITSSENHQSITGYLIEKKNGIQT